MAATSFEINQLFRERGLTLGSVESFTGGLFARTITAVPGASHFYKGGLVTYATEEKNRLLGIPFEELDQYGAVSKEIAAAMALRGRQTLNVDFCVSFTGNAGPEAMEDKPVGEVHIGIASYDGVQVFSYQLQGSRDEIQQKGVELALERLKINFFEKM